MVKSNTSYSFILLSFLLSLALTILPLDQNHQLYNPQWLVLISAYWSVRSPDRVGIITCWFWGLFMDVTLGTHMGIHAVSLAIISYVTIILHQRLRMYPIWQQSLFIWLIASLDKIIVLQLNSIFTPIDVVWSYWFSTFTTALIWPVLSIFIQKMKIKQ